MMRIARTIFLLCMLIETASGQVAASEWLRWHPQSATIDASLKGASLAKVLSDLATLTGWEVMIEPGIQSRVSTRFEGLSMHQGLRRILGTLHFALIQNDSKNSVSKVSNDSDSNDSNDSVSNDSNVSDSNDSVSNDSKNFPAKDSAANAVLYIYRESIGAATKSLSSRKVDSKIKSKRIANELILSLSPDSLESVDAIARWLNAEIIGKLDGRNIFRLRFEDAEKAERARRKLASRDFKIEDNFELDIPSRLASLNFGTSAPPRVQINPKAKDLIVIGLIDTPIQPDAFSNRDFLLPSLSIAEKATPTADAPTHGTTMAETLLRGLEMVKGSDYSNVRILPVDVYGNEEATSTFQLAAGVVAAIESGASIINMSLGGQESVPFLQELISDAHRQGVVFIGAAGNEPGTHNIFPAAYPEVVAVTSADGRGEVASYANSGGFVDVMVPGHSFVEYRGETFLINGTSASAAYVSGITAGVAATSDLPLKNVEAKIRQTLPKPPAN